MAAFTSARERRLWIFTALVVLTIYATLGLVRTGLEFLKNEGLLGVAFVLGFLLIIASVFIQAFRVRPRGIELTVSLGVIAVYLLVIVRMGIPEERSHLIEYGFVAILILEALRERVANGGQVWHPPLVAIAGAGSLGVVDEGIQAVLPNRVFDPIDMLFNLLAATMAVTASALLSWVQRRRRSYIDRSS